jgi:ribonuclease BN (tRNA processing enzyme)
LSAQAQKPNALVILSIIEFQILFMSYNRRTFIRSSALAMGSVTAASPFLAAKRQSKQMQMDDRLVLLGTAGGPPIHSYKRTPSSNAIVFNNICFVVDTGYGATLKLLDAAISLTTIKYIFITHHHSDHNLELGPLLYNMWVAGLATQVQVFAPRGLKSLLDAYWQSNQFDIEIRMKDEERPDIRTLVIAHEFTAGSVFLDKDVEVAALKNIHPPVIESYALKFKLADKIIVFSGDTAYCPALGEFASNADYLVHEVMYGPAIEALVRRRKNAAGLKASILSHHTLAEDVGKIASQANVKTLVLNHFVPSDDQTLTDEMWMNAVKTTFSGKIIVGKDLLELPL